MGNGFEFDKIVLSIALSICVIIFSNHMGNVLYSPSYFIEKRGYEIEIQDDSNGAPIKKKGIPDVIDIAAIMANANGALGEKIFNKCSVCHTPNKGGPNKVGPNLWNIVGSKTASIPGFKYSAAMSHRRQDGKKWDYEELYRYLYAPKKYIPGTKMAFAGIKNDEDRVNLIAYLRNLSDNPRPLPK